MSEAKVSRVKPPVPRTKAPDSAIAAAAASHDPAVAGEAMAVPVAAPPPSPRRRTAGAADDMLAAYRGTMAAIGESQRAVAGDVKALALEISRLAHANLSVAGDSATAMMAARSFADAVEIQLGFVRRSFDALLAGSARLSDIGARLATDASRPIVAPLAGVGRSD